MPTRTIWKFPIGIGTEDLPALRNPDVVFIGTDPSGQACAWVQHDLDGVHNTIVTLTTIGTGRVFDDGDGTWVGTYNMGPFMWHVYGKGRHVR